MENCYHILTAKMSLGIQVMTKPSQKTILSSRRVQEAEKRKKSGKKRPHPKDIPQHALHPNMVHFAPSFICTDKEGQLEEERNFRFIAHSGHTQYIHAQIHTHKH